VSSGTKEATPRVKVDNKKTILGWLHREAGLARASESERSSIAKGANIMKTSRKTDTLNQIPSPVTRAPADLQEQIRCRAYELHEQRGRDDGHQLDDWLQAELEVTQKKAKSASQSNPAR
jgi:DUF2934 family protein